MVGRRAVRPNNSNNNNDQKSGTISPLPRANETAFAQCEELLDYTSASEAETKEMKGEERACHHCFSSSKSIYFLILNVVFYLQTAKIGIMRAANAF